MEPGDRDSIQITADVIRDPTKILSPINTQLGHTRLIHSCAARPVSQGSFSASRLRQ